MADGATGTRGSSSERAGGDVTGRSAAVSAADRERISETMTAAGRGAAAREALQPADRTLAEAARHVGSPADAAAPAGGGPAPPPDTAAQRAREAAAIEAGRVEALGQTAADYVGGVFEGLKNTAQAAFEAATVGVEAVTGMVPDAFAARQAESLRNRMEAVAEQVSELPDLPEELRRTYDTQIALADQLEADYRAGRADLSVLQESARVRTAAQADLAALAVETGSIAAGAGLALKGLRVARHADGDRRRDEGFDALTPRSRAEMTAAAAEDLALEARDRPYSSADLDARARWRARRDEGSAFNGANAHRYDYNEIYVDSGVGASGRTRVDSIAFGGPNAGTVSRKDTQFAEISERTALRYVAEARTKYPPGTPIADTPRNRALALERRPLPEPLVLEIPVQARPIPQAVLDFADANDLIIRDVTGRIYR